MCVMNITTSEPQWDPKGPDFSDCDAGLNNIEDRLDKGTLRITAIVTVSTAGGMASFPRFCGRAQSRRHIDTFVAFLSIRLYCLDPTS